MILVSDVTKRHQIEQEEEKKKKKHNISVEWWSPQIIIVKIFIQGLKNCKISMNFYAYKSSTTFFISQYLTLDEKEKLFPSVATDA